MIRPTHERVLWQAVPKQMFYAGLLMLSVTLISCLLIISNYDDPEQSVKWDLYLSPLLFTLMGFISLNTKFTVTTHRIFISIFFFRAEFHRQTPDIAPILQVPLNFQGHETWRKWRKISFDDFWKYRAVLTFPEQNSKKSLFCTHLPQFKLQLFSKAQVDELLPILQRYWQLDPEINTTLITTIEKHRQEEDIGKAAIILVFSSIFIGFAALLLPLKALHFAIEPNTPIIVFILAAIMLSYAIIRIEKKKYPALSSLLCGAAVGASLFFMGLQINRFYNEQSAQTIAITMTLENIDDRSQVWRLNPEFAEKNQLDQIYIYEEWHGYVKELEQNQQYQVMVKKGRFNDYFVDQDSFRLAQPIME